jgi:hypothetical protein
LFCTSTILVQRIHRDRSLQTDNYDTDALAHLVLQPMLKILQPPLAPPRLTIDKLLDRRRKSLCRARSIQLKLNKKQQRQIAFSLRALSRNENWMRANLATTNLCDVL